MKVAIYSSKSYDSEYFDKFNTKSKHVLTYFKAPLNSETVSSAKGYEAVCVFVSDKLDRNIIEKLAQNGIKLIVLRCAGFNNVDITAANENNIKIVRVPAYSPHAVAEHAVALILTLNRKTHKAYNRVNEGNFEIEKLLGFNLYRKTVGVIGTGKIGTVFCKIMLGFGCNVVAYDIVESDDLKQIGVSYMPFDDVLGKSDIVSIHCPFTPDNLHLFNTNAFSKMKNGSMLINTGRGALINTADVIVALKSKKLGYLGIDVYEQEESLFFKDLSETIIQDDLIERLMSFHNVLITPHQGFFTKEALNEIAITTIKNFNDFEDGKHLENEVMANNLGII
jgi:D-lactate dehydrogenase